MGIVISVLAMLVIPALLISLLGRAVPPLGQLMKALAPLLGLGCFGVAVADFLHPASTKGGGFAFFALLGLGFFIYGGTANQRGNDKD